jgi:hypothetical protein
MALIFAVFSHFTASAQSVGAGSEKLYTYGDGVHAFVLRQSLVPEIGYDVALQMSDTAEVWILAKSQGVRGAVLYRNDTGRVFLRVNHIGGATLYPTPHSLGVPVLRKSGFRFEAKDGRAPEPEANLTSIEDWSRAYAYAGNKITDDPKLGKSDPDLAKIEFSDWPPSKSAYKTELIAHLSGLMENQLGETVAKIIVKIADQPATTQNDNNLTIWVNPALGFAGRPSTEKILSHLNDRGD